MHLLVIEDERALCETIVRSLRRQAYSATMGKRRWSFWAWSATIWCCWI